MNRHRQSALGTPARSPGRAATTSHLLGVCRGVVRPGLAGELAALQRPPPSAGAGFGLGAAAPGGHAGGLALTALDRLGAGSMWWTSAGVGFRSLRESIDTTTAGGRLVFHLFGVLAQFSSGVERQSG